MSTGQSRPVVPPTFRQLVFRSLHFLSHPGIRASQKLIASRFVWPKMHRDIKQWTRACLVCQLSKVHRHTLAPLLSFPVPDVHFDNIHIDIVGPLPVSNNYTYILTCIDRFTRWPEAIPIVGHSFNRSSSICLWLGISIWSTINNYYRQRFTV